MTSVTRVTARFIAGGILKTPPAMNTAVGNWLLSAYASHIWATLNPLIAQQQKGKQVVQEEIKRLQDITRKLPAEISRLSKGQVVRYQLLPDLVLGIKVSDRYYHPETQRAQYYSGPRVPDPGWLPYYELASAKKTLRFQGYGQENLQQVIERSQATIQNVINHLNRKPVYSQNEQRLVELVRLRKECQRLTDKPKLYRNRAQKVFPVQLEGWNYAKTNGPLLQNINVRNAEHNATIQREIGFATTNLELAQKAYDIGVTEGSQSPAFKKLLEQIENNQEKQQRNDVPGVWGMVAWSPHYILGAVHDKKRPSSVSVRVPWVGEVRLNNVEKHFKEILAPDDLYGVLKHQSFDKIKVILNFTPHAGRVGVWKSDVRELQVDVKTATITTVDAFEAACADMLGTLRHELQHVGDSLLSTFLALGEDSSRGAGPPRKLRSPATRETPHALRDVEFQPRLADEIQDFKAAIRKIKLENRREFFNSWIGVSKPRFGFHRLFFTELKENQLGKWKKAVAEFSSQVSHLL